MPVQKATYDAGDHLESPSRLQLQGQAEQAATHQQLIAGAEVIRPANLERDARLGRKSRVHRVNIGHDTAIALAQRVPMIAGHEHEWLLQTFRDDTAAEGAIEIHAHAA